MTSPKGLVWNPKKKEKIFHLGNRNIKINRKVDLSRVSGYRGHLGDTVS